MEVFMNTREASISVYLIVPEDLVWAIVTSLSATQDIVTSQ